MSEEWTRAGSAGDTIVVGRGGWLRLPEELLARAGIAERATARFDEGRIVVAAAEGHRSQAVASPTFVVRREQTDERPHALVEVRGLAKRFGRNPVFEGVDATIGAGRLHVVTGPSGSGKTTFLHLLAGLELPDAGEIVVDGLRLAGLDRTARAELRRARVGFVGQQPGLVPFLSARENVELALALRGHPPDRALETIDSVGLSERAEQRVSRLSAGERERVAFARALAPRPKIVLLDEPTSKLDQANALAAAGLLARLARETGATIVCATHDPVVIDHADDRLDLT